MRRIIVLILALLCGTSALASTAPAARADGDPASDILLSAPVFVPPDAGSTSAAIDGLRAAVAAANAAGVHLRVALIGSVDDLGTVTQLMGQPSRYAYYLSRELQYVFGGAVLVVMPQGFGLWPQLAPGRVPPAYRQRLASLTAPGSALAGPATQLVGVLAGAAGHPIVLPTPGRTLAGSVRGVDGGSDIALLGFFAGLVAVVIAWGLSLRRRPLQRRALA